MSIQDSEAEKIYHSIFKKRIPASIQAHFNIISKKIDSRYSGEEVKKYSDCIENVRDLEALEIAARYFKKIPVLTEKFNIMVYLAETLPENYTVFVNERSNYHFASLLLLWSMFRTVCKVAKGLFILKVNRL